MSLPNFMIIGAKKAATTSLYEYLRQHPDVFMSDPKEPNYFAYEADNPAFAHYTRVSFPIRTEEEYRGLFDGVTTETAIGEASVGYLESPTAPARIHTWIPENRMIVSLRNPVERAYSAHLMETRNGVESRSLVDIVRASRSQMEERFYSRSLQRWFGIFPRSQFRIVLYEDIKRDPAGVVRSLYQFLDVNPGFMPDMSERFNRGGVPKSAVRQAFVNRMRRLRRYRSHVPRWMRNRFTAFARDNLAPLPAMSPEIKDLLYDVYLDDIVALENLLDLDLRAWKDPEHADLAVRVGDRA